MPDLKELGEELSALITAQDGSWQLKKELSDSIEKLRIAAMGPAQYTSRLRYQVWTFRNCRNDSMNTDSFSLCKICAYDCSRNAFT